MVNSLRWLWFHFLAINTAAARKQNDANGTENRRRSRNAGKVRNGALVHVHGVCLMAISHTCSSLTANDDCVDCDGARSQTLRPFPCAAHSLAENHGGEAHKTIASRFRRWSSRMRKSRFGLQTHLMGSGECCCCKSLEMMKTTIKEATASN